LQTVVVYRIFQLCFDIRIDLLATSIATTNYTLRLLVNERPKSAV
jgi:hypothetical protein